MIDLGLPGKRGKGRVKGGQPPPSAHDTHQGPGTPSDQHGRECWHRRRRKKRGKSADSTSKGGIGAPSFLASHGDDGEGHTCYLEERQGGRGVRSAAEQAKRLLVSRDRISLAKRKEPPFS